MEALQTENYKNFVFKVYPDFDAENPLQEYGVLGEFISWDRRHNFGNKVFENITELKTYIQRRRCFVFSWYIYKHSGIAFSLKNQSYPFNDIWDAWQLGHIVVPIKRAKENFGKSVTQEQVQKCIEGELKAYEKYINGEIYYVSVEDENGDQIDACGGIFDVEDYIQECKMNIDKCLSTVAQ